MQLYDGASAPRARAFADRLDDFEPNAVAHAGKAAAESLARGMRPLGIPRLFERARAAFLDTAGDR